MFKLKKRSAYRLTLPLTALIDIVFLLLIYFLLTSSFVSRSGLDLDLPRAESAVSVSSVLMVEVDRKGNIFWKGRMISLKDLETILRKTFIQNSDRRILIRADGRTSLSKVVAVMDLARRCGAKGVALATIPPEQR